MPCNGHSVLRICRTARFSVLNVTTTTDFHDQHDGKGAQRPRRNGFPHAGRQSRPLFNLLDMLHLKASDHDRLTKCGDEIFNALRKHGYCKLRVPRTSQPGRIIADLQASLNNDLFPLDSNAANLLVSNETYVSEKGIPMYRLGYELAPDGMREFYRVAAGDPDVQLWPNENVRAIWLRALGLLRHVTDVLLDLLLLLQRDHDVSNSDAPFTGRRRRPYSGRGTWQSMDARFVTTPAHELLPRPGDFSVMYAMHYFNDAALDDEDKNIHGQGHHATTEPAAAAAKLVLKAHVDPSLLVLEPFLCHTTRGLQVWDEYERKWVDMDGSRQQLQASAAAAEDSEGDIIMLLFGGKALAQVCHVPAALHRVVQGTAPRRTVIYEQKYEEFFPTPTFD